MEILSFDLEVCKKTSGELFAPITSYIHIAESNENEFKSVHPVSISECIR